MRDCKRELEQSQARISKFDEIIQRLYEDNIEGKISDERFAKMTANYEAEQHTLESRVAELKSTMTEENSERDEIEQIINDIFTIHKKKEFPTQGKSQGYKAIHYRGTIKANALTEQQQRYSKANVEIQVASLLMHAWAEVEHDIVYKPLKVKFLRLNKKH